MADKSSGAQPPKNATNPRSASNNAGHGKDEAAAASASTAPPAASSANQGSASQAKGGSAATNGTNVGQYVLSKTIGKGTFGKVKLGVHNLTGEKVAVKILEKDKIQDVNDVERVAREIHILKMIRHPNII